MALGSKATTISCQGLHCVRENNQINCGKHNTEMRLTANNGRKACLHSPDYAPRQTYSVGLVFHRLHEFVTENRASLMQKSRR